MPFSNRNLPTSPICSARREGNLDDREARARFGVCTPRRSSASRTRFVFAQRSVRSASPRRSFTSSPASVGRERGNRRRAGVEIRRRGRLEQPLHLGRARDEGGERRVGLREPGDEHDVLVALAEVADDAVPPRAVRRRLVVAALADHAEAVRVVDVEDRAVLARERGVRTEVGDVAGHAVDAVDADQARADRSLRSSRSSSSSVVVLEPLAASRREASRARRPRRPSCGRGGRRTRCRSPRAAGSPRGGSA